MTHATLLLCLLALPLITAAVVLSYPLHAAFFFWRQRRRLKAGGAAPRRVSLIVPIKGVDDELRANFRSWTEQRLDAPYELLICVEEEHDPAVAAVRALIEERRAQGTEPPRMEILITGASRAALGEVSLGKMHNLLHGIARARGDWLVFVDSDALFADADYLRRFCHPLRDRDVGLVTCYPAYRGARDLGATLIGWAINNDLVGFVGLVGSWQRRVALAVGTTLALRRETVDRLGGLEFLRRQLLMDVTLANRVRQADLRVHVCEEPVGVYQRHFSGRAALQQADRWHIGMRRVLPVWLYALYLSLRLSLPLTLAGLALAPSRLTAGVALTFVASRMLAAWLLDWRYIRDPALLRSFWMLPLIDLLMAASATLALFRRRIAWRGRSYEIGRGGRARFDEPRGTARLLNHPPLGRKVHR